MSLRLKIPDIPVTRLRSSTAHRAYAIYCLMYMEVGKFSLRRAASFFGLLRIRN